jgi:hypothetical protein
MDKPEHVTPTEELAAFLAAVTDLEQRGEHDAAAHVRKAQELMTVYFRELDAGRLEAADPWIKAAMREVNAANALLRKRSS